MAKEYIKYNQLIEKIDWDNDLGKWCIYDDDLDSIPAAEVAPVVHGEWIWADDGYLRCSNCHQKAPVMTQYQDEPMTVATDYCPNCGAKMDLEG